jgi:anti-sigma B factor antagonist
MSCSAVVRYSGNVAILDLAGRIVLGEGSGILRTAIRDLIEIGESRILLNLRGVTYMDSSGLGEMVSAYTSVRKSGGEVRLLSPSEKLDSLMQLTKLYTIFVSFNDEAAAVASFAAAS